MLGGIRGDSLGGPLIYFKGRLSCFREGVKQANCSVFQVSAVEGDRNRELRMRENCFVELGYRRKGRVREFGG